MKCQRCHKQSVSKGICAKCRKIMRPKGHLDKLAKQHDRTMKKSPPLEELNHLWSKLRSYEKIAKHYGVSRKTIETWIGDEKLLIEPNRLYQSETCSKRTVPTKKKEDNLIVALYRLFKNWCPSKK